MRLFTAKLRTVFSAIISLVLFFTAEAALAQGNSQGNANSNAGGNGNGNAFGNSKNIGVGNASDGIKARISTNKGLIYTGDPLEISVSFPRGAELVTGGEVDAYVVIFAPTIAVSNDSSTDDSSDDSSSDDSDSTGTGTANALSEPVVVPVSDSASVNETRLFEIPAVDLSTLSAGTYQLGLVLTNPGGNPLVLGDWYAGLLGLVDVVGLTITDEAVEFDSDMDGQVDDDSDGDGLSDDDSDDDSDNDSDSSSDSSSST